MSLNKSKSLRTAEKYVLQGKIPAAIDEYRKVVDADPADLTTINTLGDLYVRAGRIQDAIQVFSRIAESYRDSGFTLKAIAMLKKISKLDPTNVDTSMKLANLYSQQGLFVEARQQYLQVADAYARAGQTRKALEAYQKIADLDPTNTSVRMKLGEIYWREGMTELSHEAFIMAGAELTRKGDTEAALNANLKALSVEPDSRQALTAIVTIYTQQGQVERAINILCDAFEKNPGDVELLTILGRTYLSADRMDEAERTFLSLVELDRNRYHYLIEVGRKFLQMGDLDRAAEQIDGCLEVLIAKREEDKAIDFLRRVLDRDMNHVGSLKRLAQIYARIREDHNLIATLNSLADATMRNGDEQEAIVALTELARAEPDEPRHRQRLYNLGVSDLADVDGADVVRATGPLDYQSAAFDDAFVIRQISEAEILAGHGQIEHAVNILGEILTHTPDNVQIHLKLKDIFLRAGVLDRAANECLELSRIHQARGEPARANDYLTEAQQLNPLMESAKDKPWPDNGQSADGGFDLPPEGSAGGFEIREFSGSLDLSRYQTGALSDEMRFVMVPEGGADRQQASSGSIGNSMTPGFSEESHPYQRHDREETAEGAELTELTSHDFFSSAGGLPSDTMAGLLRDELEGVDFYIAQGYLEIAHDTLDRLRQEHGEHPEILARYKRLGIAAAPTREITMTPPAMSDDDGLHADSNAEAPLEPDSDSRMGTFFLADVPNVDALEGSATTGELLPLSSDQEAGADGNGHFGHLDLPEADADQYEGAAPLFVQQGAGQIASELPARFNTGELLTDTDFDSHGLLEESGETDAFAYHVSVPESELTASEDLNPAHQAALVEPSANGAKPIGTAELIESIVTDIGEGFGSIHTWAPAPEEQINVTSGSAIVQDQVSHPNTDSASVPWPSQHLEPAAPVSPEAGAVDDELKEMLEDLKGNTAELKPTIDFETHYSLGLAYKDMGLVDEAIEQFQFAHRLALAGTEDDHIQCCHMLGICFRLKNMPKVAIMWYQRGLKVLNRSEDEYQALRFEIGLCYEEIGDLDNAIETFTEVYGIDVNYRRVADKIRELQAAKNA
jgi:tetratricopeptide (TPR) repeat protein